MAKKKTAVVINKNGKKAGDPIALDGAAPLKIKALPNVKYLLKGEGDVGPENATLTRVGDDLHVTLEGETSPALVLEGFYALAEPSGIYGVAEDGQLYAYGRTDGGDIYSLADGQMAPIALAGDPVPPGPVGEDDHFAFWPLLLGGAALAGLVAAIAHDGGSDGVEPVVVKPPEPAQKPTTSGIGQVIDHEGSITGPIADGGVTDDVRLEFTGQGESGNTITITDKDGSIIGTTIVKPDGSWSVTPDHPLTEGPHSIIVTETDKDGNKSDPSDPFEFKVDTTAPGAPVIGNVIDDAGNITGPITNGGSTDDTRPEFKGEGGEPGNLITITDKDGSVIGVATVKPDSSWSVTPDKPLTEGPHSVTVTETDPAGNKSDPSDPFEFKVDTTAPGKPVIGSVIDDAGTVTGPITNGGVTDDTQPEFKGEGGEPGSTITITDKGGVVIGTATVKPDGSWSVTPDTPLTEGPHSVTVTETDPAGNKSKPSDPFEFKVDTTAPGVPVIGSVIDDVGNITGPIANGGVTDDTRPEFKGQGEPGGLITVTDEDGSVIGTATVKPDGSWSVTPDTPLTEGSHSVTVTATDPAGNKSDSSDPFEFKVDTAAPGAPVIGNVIDDVGDITGPITNGGVTDDAKPEFKGEGGEPGNLITITDKDGSVIGATTVKPDGSWSVTPDKPLTEGPHSVTVTETDPAGNKSDPSDPFEFKVDTTAPGKPVIGSVIDDAGEITGPITNGGVTDDTKPEFKGEGGEPGNLITLTDEKGAVIGSTTVDPDGNWSVTPKDPLEEGPHSVIVTETDPAGNKSDPSDPFEFSVDLTAPPYDKLAITGVEDNVDPVTGNVASGGTTDDSHPLIKGTGTAGDTVIVSVADANGSHELGRALVDGDGNWSLQVSGESLASGVNTFTAVEMDPAGNKTPPSAPYTVTVDVAGPNAPVIENVRDDVGEVHFLQKGEVTNDDTPTIIGTAEPKSLVTIYDGSTPLGSVQADDNGKWEFTTASLKDGPHSITATATDAAGQVSAPTGPWGFSVDTQAPAAVDDLKVIDNAGDQTGNLKDGDTTDDSTPTFKGTAEPGGVVTIYDGKTELGSVKADDKGQWEFTPKTELDDGPHSFTTVVTDPAGNQSEPSPELKVTIDTSGVVVSIGAVVDNVGPNAGEAIDRGGVTDDARPVIIGKGKPGSIVTVYDGTTELGSTTVNSRGEWSFTPKDNLQDQDGELHHITAVAKDAGTGNLSAPTEEFPFRVDTQAPSAPVIGSVTDDVGPKQDPLHNGDTTDDPSPTLKGTAEPDSIVTVYDKGEVLGSVQTSPDGSWTFTPTTGLPEGEHVFTTTATDEAGNVSGKSDEFKVITDYTPPDASKLAITGVDDDIGGVTGNVADGATTDDSQPLISGTGTAGDVVVVSVANGRGTSVLGSATVDANGKWTLQVGDPLPSGSNDFTAVEFDPAGNRTDPSAGYQIVVDITQPEVPVIVNVRDDEGPVHDLQKGEVTNDATPTIIGTSKPLHVIHIFDGKEELGSVTADANGDWVFTTKPLGDGPHDITATATNPVGQTSLPTGVWNFSVDTKAPAAVDDLRVIDDAGAQTGDLKDGDTTDDATPTFKGTAEPGSVVTVYDGKTELGSAKVDDKGQWEFTPSEELKDGPHNFTTVVTDPAGNESEPSPEVHVIVDTSRLPVSIGALVDNVGDIQGNIKPNGVTDDVRPEIQGKGKPGSAIEVFDGTERLGATKVNPDGTWSFTPGKDLPQNDHSITVKQTDPTGNESKAGPFNFSIDTEAPAAPTIGEVLDDVNEVDGTRALANGGATDDSTPTLKGTAEPDSIVTVYDKGEPLGSVQAGKDGNWSFTPTTPLPEGEHVFTAKATDEAGNVSGKSDEFKIITDYTVPGAPVIGGVEDDVAPITGPVTDHGSTNDNRPTISGTGGTVGEKVYVYDNGVKIGEADVKPDGSWSFTPAEDKKLSDADHRIEATNVDAAGNESAKSNPFEFTVDTKAPTQATTIEGVYDDVAADGSALAVAEKIGDGGYTNDTTPQLRGTLSDVLGAGEKVVVLRDGAVIGTATVNGKGWTFDDSGLADGKTYIYEARVEDAAGNQGGVSQDYTVRVDTSAPTQKPTIDSVWDDVNPATGVVANNGTTNDTQPELRGSLQSGLAGNEKVAVYRQEAGGAEVFVGYAKVSGTSWTLVDEKGGVKNDTAYTYTAQVEDAAGNVGPVSDGYKITMLWDGPETQATITGVNDDQAPVTGPVANDGWTNDKTPQLVGTLSEKLVAGEKVVIQRDGVEIGTATVDGTGLGWTFDDSGLDDGKSYVYKAVVQDAAGNAGSDSNTWTINVDLTPPPQDVVLTQIVDNKGDKQVPITSGGSADPANVIDDDTPRLEGTISKALSGTEEVHVFRNGVDIGKATMGADGLSWSYDDASLSNGGKYDYVARVVDAAGNTSDPSNSLGFTLNTDTIVVGVSIQQVIDDKAPGLEAVLSGGTTNDDTPLLKGSVTVVLGAGDVVEIYRDGVKLGNATVTGTTWEYQDSGLSAERAYSYEAHVVSVTGNNVGTSIPFILNFDNTPPPATAPITSYVDDVAPQTGDYLSGSQTNDTTPLLKGTVVGVLAAGEVVVVYRDGVKLGNATVTGTNWTYQDGGLADGHTYSYTTRVEDAGGNQGQVSDPFTLTVDTTVPGAPVIGGVEDDVAPITGPVTDHGSTNDNRPTISGTGGTVGEKVYVYDNGVKIGEADVKPDGSWSFTPAEDKKLIDAEHRIEATNVDAAGNESAKSNPFEFTVDTKAPTQATTIEGVYDDVAADGSALAVAEKIGNGGYTNDTTPQLRGTLSGVLGAGEKVVVLRDGTVIGEATANGTSWTFDDSGLADGKTYIYTARVEDAAGNRGGVSGDYVVRVDTSAPTQKPTIDSVWDDVDPATGVVANNGTTNDTQPELRGSLQSGLAGNEKVAVYRQEAGGAEVFVGYAKVSGTSWTLVDEKGGVKNDTAYTYTAQVEDAAGNVGPVSDGYKITMLWDGPETQAKITGVNDDQAPVTGPVANDGWTNDKTPQLVGTLSEKLVAGEKVVIQRDGVEIGTATVDGTGLGWTFDDSGLDDGKSYVYKAVVQDAAGNAGSDSNTWTINVDLTPPTQEVVLTQIVDDQGDKQDPIKSGGSAVNTIDDDTPRLEGTISKPLSGTEEVHVFRNGVDIGKATMGADGLSWSYQDGSLSSGGKYDYEARVVDAAGNASDPSNSLGFTLNTDIIAVGVSILQVDDNKEPGLEAVLSGGTTNDDTPLLKGAVTVALGAGDVVEIYRDGVKLGNATVTGTTWTYQDSGLDAERAYIYEARAVNVAGNNVGTSNKFVLNFDNTPPEATAPIESYFDNFDPLQGDFLSGSQTNDTTPLLKGTVVGALAVGEVVVVYRDGVKLGNAVVNGTSWTYQDGGLADGHTYSYTTRVEDAGGNQGAESKVFTLTVDTTAPGAPVISGVEDDKPYIEGPVANGGATNDERPTINGSGGTFGEKVYVYDNGVKIGEADVKPDGSWSFTPEAGKELDDGAHRIEATNVDAAGNESAKSNEFGFTLDTDAPRQATTIEGVYDDVAADGSALAVAEKIGNGGWTNDTTPQVRGTLSDVLAAGEKVVILRDGAVIGEATTNGTNWTFDDAGVVDGNTYIYTARVEDAAGNRGGISSDYVVHVDTSKPPQTVVITTVWDDQDPMVGNVPNGGSTNDSQPELRGTLSAGLAGNEMLAVYRDNVKIGYATVDGTGTNWKYVDTTGQLENHGSYSYEARVEDAAGNYGANSQPYAITLELEGPDNRATITALNDDEAPVTGPVANDGWTNDLTPQLQGTLQKALEAGQKVVVYRDGAKLGEATMDGTGTNWSYDDSGLANGGHYVYTVYVQDAADNRGVASNNWTVNVDTVAPPQTVELTQILDNEGSVTGPIANGGVSDDDTPRLEGKVSEALSGTEEVRIFRNGVDIGKATLNGDGLSWWYQDASLSNKSTYSYEARVVDAAGNESAHSNSISFTLDKDPGSQTVTILQVLDDLLPVTGTVAQNGTTNDDTPLLSGSVGATLKAGEVVVIYRDGVKLAGTAVVNGTTWTYQDSGLVEERAYEYKAVVVSAAGVEGGLSSPYVINFDVTAPTATAPITSYIDDYAPQTGEFLSGSQTNDTTPLLKGTVVGVLAAGEVVVVYRDGVKLGNATVTGTNWTYQDGGLADGHTYSYTTRVEDAGGNQGQVSDPFTLTVDTTVPPQTVSITSYVDDHGVNTGDFDFASHPVTDDKSPLIKGSLNAALNAGERVVVYRDGVEIGSATVAGNGTGWTYQDNGLDQGTGSHVYTAKVVDLAGNVGAVSNEVALRFEDLLELRADDTVVHEAALPGGTGLDWLLDDGSATSDLSASGVFSLGSTVTGVSITLGGQDTGLTLADLAGGSKTVTAGGDTLVITSLGDGQYSYVYTLGAPKLHDTSGGKVGETKPNDFVITATNGSGKSLSATGGITVVNDEVRGDNKDFVIEIPDSASGVGITLVLDMSGSMNAPDGGKAEDGTDLTRWQQAKASLLILLDEYENAYPASTQFQVNIVLFDDAMRGSGTFGTLAEARAFIVGAPSPDVGGTLYQRGLNEAEKLIGKSMADHPEWDQKVYFITDGLPEENGGVPGSWKTFVSGANQDLIDVYGVALGPLVTGDAAELAIRAALAEGDVNDKFIPVKNPQDLANALLDTLPRVEGSLFDSTDLYGDFQSVVLGGDRGFELSKVTVNGKEYVFGADKTITVKVTDGLTMEIESNGHYTIVSSLSHPNLKVEMTFDLTDADGDKATVTEQIQFGNPHQVLITGYVDNEGLTTGDFDFVSHPTTDDVSPLIKGVLSEALAAGERVDVYRDGVLRGTAVVSGTGTTWTFQDDGLSAGRHVYTAKWVEAGGGEGASSNAVSLAYENLLDLRANDTVVHEAALQGGTGKNWLLNDGSDTSDLTAGGSFSIGAGATGVSMTLGGLDAGISLADLRSLTGSKTVTVGGDTLTITSLGNGQYAYGYTLATPKHHDTSGGKVGETVHNDFKITVSDGSKSLSATGEIVVVNDEVIASPGDFNVEVPSAAQGVAITIILDASPSMTLTVDSGPSRWALAKTALLGMLDEYQISYPASTPFEINFEVFDGSVLSHSYSSIAAAKAGISAQAVGVSGTDYSTALTEAQKLIQASMAKHPDYDQKVYFITDGEPNSAPQGVPDSWKTFVAVNSDVLDVYGVGLGPGVTSSVAIDEIKKALDPNDPTDVFIPVLDAQDLADVLLKTLPVVSGNLFDTVDASGQHQSVALGGDRAFSLSKVSIGGIDYQFGAADTVTVNVQPGFKIEIAKDGTYKITTSLTAPDIRLPVTFGVTDADGDTSVVTEQLHFTSAGLGLYQPVSISIDFQGEAVRKLDAGTYDFGGVHFKLVADTANNHANDPAAFQGIIDGTTSIGSQLFGATADATQMRALSVWTADPGEILRVDLPQGKEARSVSFDLGDDDRELQVFKFYDVDGKLLLTQTATGGDGLLAHQYFEMPDGKSFSTLTTSAGDNDQLWFDNFQFNDVGLVGTAGDDTIRIGNVDFGRVNGGAGIDTLVMDGSNMHIDLSALGPKVTGIEQFDLGTAGSNKLTLSTNDVLTNGHADMLVADGKTQMVVKGMGDVDLQGGTTGAGGWTVDADKTIGGTTYHVYTNVAGTSELLVDDRVHVTIL